MSDITLPPIHPTLEATKDDQTPGLFAAIRAAYHRASQGRTKEPTQLHPELPAIIEQVVHLLEDLYLNNQDHQSATLAIDDETHWWVLVLAQALTLLLQQNTVQLDDNLLMRAAYLQEELAAWPVSETIATTIAEWPWRTLLPQSIQIAPIAEPIIGDKRLSQSNAIDYNSSVKNWINELRDLEYEEFIAHLEKSWLFHASDSPLANLTHHLFDRRRGPEERYAALSATARYGHPLGWRILARTHRTNLPTQRRPAPPGLSRPVARWPFWHENPALHRHQRRRPGLRHRSRRPRPAYSDR